MNLRLRKVKHGQWTGPSCVTKEKKKKNICWRFSHHHRSSCCCVAAQMAMDCLGWSDNAAAQLVMEGYVKLTQPGELLLTTTRSRGRTLKWQNVWMGLVTLNQVRNFFLLISLFILCVCFCSHAPTNVSRTISRPSWSWKTRPTVQSIRWRSVWNKPSKKPQSSSSKISRIPGPDLQFTGWVLYYFLDTFQY